MTASFKDQGLGIVTDLNKLKVQLTGVSSGLNKAKNASQGVGRLPSGVSATTIVSDTLIDFGKFTKSFSKVLRRARRIEQAIKNLQRVAGTCPKPKK